MVTTCLYWCLTPPALSSSVPRPSRSTARKWWPACPPLLSHLELQEDLTRAHSFLPTSMVRSCPRPAPQPRLWNSPAPASTKSGTFTSTSPSLLTQRLHSLPVRPLPPLPRSAPAIETASPSRAQQPDSMALATA